MQGLDKEQVRHLIVRPAIAALGMWSQAAENLDLGTGLVESDLASLKQQRGPALGLWQMEPLTHDDLHRTFKPSSIFTLRIFEALRQIGGYPAGTIPAPELLIYNLRYAAAMCRIKYYRSPDSLPEAHDVLGLANMWKNVYNTAQGAGKVETAIPMFNLAVASA